MIESGTHEPDADPAAWHLPDGTALRYERPAPSLRSLIADYVVLDSDPAVFKGPSSWLLPGSPKLWVALTPDVRIKTRSRPISELGAAVLIGPSSITMPTESRGGVSIVIEPTPRGWARLFDVSAASLRDRIVPLDQHLRAGWTAEMLARLHACDRGADVKSVLDAFFIERLPSPTEHEDGIARIEQLIVDEAGSGDILGWAARADIGSPRTLARMCESYFGFGPKLLQRRHRFLRVFAAMLIAPEPVDFRIVPPGYHDVPHFLRDARHFLGMTARQFLAMPMLYLRAALRARTAVLGTPLPLLDAPEPPA
ncbi:helix-turn-helix domain-containing protein [Sphingomonas bacterium]|uniref:helix-turn-helix domain-containing protein n=1 Tax=Sphingomonas bacterium TaxID=1895847 RepID=UPI001576C681|nr:helix-turn-helix domain-containing protein [Sphingomonas bacterium]